MRSSVVGCVPNRIARAPADPGRRGCARRAALQVDQRLRVVGDPQGEGVRAGLDLARELVSGHVERRSSRPRSPGRGRGSRPAIRARRPRAAARPELADRGAGRAAPRARRTRSPAGCLVRQRAQLVGHDRLQLGALGVLDQVVVEDDPLGRPEPGDVRVQRGRAPAGVDAVDLADVDLRAPPSSSTSARSGLPSGSSSKWLNCGAITIGASS